MVFADLVGSTEMAAGLDPEDVRGRLEPFFEVARETLSEHGGTLEKYIGDAVLAVFGVPVSHGDDPDRAVAAALALLERVEALDSSLKVRIGVETGEVLAGDRDGDLSVTGEAVNIAARLQQAAAPGEVLVGERAGRSCRRVVLEPAPAVEAKGLRRPLSALRASGTDGQPDRTATSLVGRENDIELLRLIYRRAARERVPELVTIIGEAGIGKTRLASELTRGLGEEPDPPRVLVGRNPPYGRGIAFWALGEVLRDAAGTPEEAPVAEVERELESLLARLGAEDAAEIAASLARALGGAEDDGEASVEEGLRRSWRRFVGLLAAERPLIIGIDDAHWADDGLLDLLEEAVIGLGEAPLLLLCTSRPELMERRPNFGRAVGNVSQVELRPLDEAAATALAEQLLPHESKSLAPEVAEASGGNPFFAEEVSCALREANGGKVVEALPDTVQATIAGRIDLLPAAEKRVLQHAAVLGHAFGAERLMGLLGASASAELTELARKALVEEQVERGAGHFAFRHQLIRDVAYSSLPRSERVRLHERAAEEIHEDPGGRYAELAELRAFHLAEAAALEPSGDRADRAREALLEAADFAVRRGAGGRGRELYEQAAGLAAVPIERAGILRTASEIALRRWEGAEALRLLRETAGIFEEAGERTRAAGIYARMVEVATRMGGISGRVAQEESRSIQAKARALADPADPVIQAQLRLNEAWIAWAHSREDEMAEPAREGLAMARETGDPTLISAGARCRPGAGMERGTPSAGGPARPGATRVDRREPKLADARRGAERRSAHDGRVAAADRSVPRGGGVRRRRQAARSQQGNRLLSLGARDAPRLLPGRVGHGARKRLPVPRGVDGCRPAAAGRDGCRAGLGRCYPRVPRRRIRRGGVVRFRRAGGSRHLGAGPRDHDLARRCGPPPRSELGGDGATLRYGDQQFLVEDHLPLRPRRGVRPRRTSGNRRGD